MICVAKELRPRKKEKAVTIGRLCVARHLLSVIIISRKKKVLGFRKLPYAKRTSQILRILK